jgi:hypothetical protein
LYFELEHLDSHDGGNLAARGHEFTRSHRSSADETIKRGANYLVADRPLSANAIRADRTPDILFSVLPMKVWQGAASIGL